MVKSNLLSILSTLEQKEFREFGEYVRSPFFNKNESVIKLYEYLAKYYPEFPEDKITKEKAFKKIFPGADYSDDFMRTIMFNLTSLLEEYIAYANFRNTPFSELRHLLYELNERGLDKILKRTFKKAETALNKYREKDEGWYYTKYYVSKAYNYYLSRLHSSRYEKFLKENNIEVEIRDVTKYYLSETLKMHMILLNNKKLYNVKTDTESYEKILESIDINIIESEPPLDMYFHSIKLLKDESETAYEHLKDRLSTYIKVLPENAISDLFINLENFCARNIRSGKEKYVRDLFQISRAELKTGTYYYHSYMPGVFYKSIVETGLQVGEFEWVKDFMRKYKKELDPEIKDDTIAYVNANYELYSGNTEEALSLLSKVNAPDLQSKLDVKVLGAKIYYELGLEDSLLSLIDSFRHFLKNQKYIHKEKRSSYSAFMNCIKKLSKLKAAPGKPSPGAIEELTHEIQSAPLVYYRFWLLEKAEELKS